MLVKLSTQICENLEKTVRKTNKNHWTSELEFQLALIFFNYVLVSMLRFVKKKKKLLLKT